MDRVESRVEALTRWPARLEQRLSEAMAETDALREAIEGVQKELKRMGRQQFKANTLDETRTERWQDTVETLESALSRREGEIAAIRFEHRQAVEAARQEWLSALLPVLDGLQDAFAAGNAQIDRLQARYDQREAEQRQRRGLLARFRPSWSRTTDAPDHDALTSLSAWLDGLRVLRDRTWALLEKGGVRALPTVGHPFDPHLHVAVDTLDRSDVAAGTIVAERRRGYRVGERVVRFAEVIVARTPIAREEEQA
jgi:molecular chaperone GrpE